MEEHKKYHRATRLIHGRMRSEAWEYEHHLVPPISTSTTFRLDDVLRGAAAFQEYASEDRPDQHIYIYDRLREPNKDLLEENLAMAEGGDVAVSFACGMAAISAALGVLLKQGDRLVAHHALYGCTHSLLTSWLPRMGIDVVRVDCHDDAEVRQALSDEARVLYFETPVNPTMDLIDIARMARLVEEANRGRRDDERIQLVVDNTFATPFCQRPIEHGADFVVHSLTKGICGFGTDMGGAVIGPAEFYSLLLLYRKDFGGVLSPRAAWSILTYGLPSLSVRMKQAQSSARQIAEYLEAHPLVDRVSYPGLASGPHYDLAQRQMRDLSNRFAPGILLYFELAGSTPEEQQEAGIRFIDHLASEAYTVTLAVSLGNVRTLIEHPSSMTHAPIPPEEQMAAGIHPSGIRISVGLEEPDDIIHDLEAALEVIRMEVV